MNECIHGFADDQCATRADAGTTTRSTMTGSMAGKSFALIYAPAFRDDTFMQLNREGDHWKIRHYPSPSEPAIELAPSAPSSSGPTRELKSIELQHEIAFPYSTAPGGVTIKDSRY